MRGRFNFDEIRIEYFRDEAALFEAFKAGEIDLRTEDDPGRWVEGYGFAAVTDGRVVREEFDLAVPSGMSAFVLNTRRSPFHDQRVRRAFDPAVRRGVDQPQPLQRPLPSHAELLRPLLPVLASPAGRRRRARLLAPFGDLVKREVLDGTFSFLATDGSGDNRGNMQAAFKLLSEAGIPWSAAVSTKGGVPLKLEFLAQTRWEERVMLSFARTLDRLGIELRIRQVDNAQFELRRKTFDFDIVQWTWLASLSPGNEQINRFSSRTADSMGSQNLAAPQPAADAMIQALLRAEFRAGLRRGRARLRPGADLGRLRHPAVPPARESGSRTGAT